MPHGPQRDHGKEQFWRDALSRWRDSGLTIRAFCRRHRLAEPSFYAWRREFQRAQSVRASALSATNATRHNGATRRIQTSRDG
jgi:hypothetical protein